MSVLILFSTFLFVDYNVNMRQNYRVSAMPQLFKGKERARRFHPGKMSLYFTNFNNGWIKFQFR